MHNLDRPVWTSTCSRVAAGLGIGLASAGLIYAAAVTSASVLAGSFTKLETAKHLRAVEFSDRLTRARQERAARVLSK